jgi:hypothetical protein
MKASFLLISTFALIVSSAQAAKVNTGIVDYFAPDQTVHYTNCEVEFVMDTAAVVNSPFPGLRIQKLHTLCKSPTYWVFDQQMRTTVFTTNAEKKLFLDGLDVGAVDAQGNFKIAYDANGEKVFLNGTKSKDGFKLEWSARSFDGVNFDLSAKF